MNRSPARRAAGAEVRRTSLRTAAGVLAAAVAAVVTAGPAAASTAASTGASTAPSRHAAPSSAAGHYLVRATGHDLAAVRGAVRRTGGTVTRTIGLIDTVAVTVPAGGADRLRHDPAVREVTADAAVHLMDTSTTTVSSTYSAATDPYSMANIEKALGVRYGWSRGLTGKGVDVALIDSGVAPVEGLATSGKVVYGPDLTEESQIPSLRNLDGFGHGTHLAGIIAGRDSATSTYGSTMAADSTHFYGMAPDARIVSVKAADALGNTDVSQVVAGIDWVVQHAHDPGMNIRVLNLSFGTDSAQPYQLDPLAYAAEQAWLKGIVVVVSAGNSGAASGRLTDPATDPYVVAIGAEDGTGYDDRVATIPSFSSHGDGVRNPDLVVPGAHIQSLRVPGSYIDQQHGSTGQISDRFFRGSGTSQAAAMASGGVALLLQAKPWLTPDQVKSVVTSTAVPLPSADQTAQGNGRLNPYGAFSASPALLPQAFVRSTGLGTLEGSRGSYHLTTTDGKRQLTGEVDLMGSPVSTTLLAAQELAGNSWAGGAWNGNSWAGNSWAGNSWAGNSWAGNSWAGNSWAGNSWAGNSWAGNSWAGNSWAGNSWAGNSWAGNSWAGNSWADGAWSSSAWLGHSWN